jgi:hypothetical protein
MRQATRRARTVLEALPAGEDTYLVTDPRCMHCGVLRQARHCKGTLPAALPKDADMPQDERQKKTLLVMTLVRA